MEINVAKLIGGVVGVLSLALLLGSGYFLYDVFFNGAQVDPTVSVKAVTTDFFGPKAQKAASAITDPKQKISLRHTITQDDIAFTEKELFKSFTDLPESVPLSESRGRPDPFTPYVAP